MKKKRRDRCCFYVRVSTEDQYKYGYSVDAQIDTLKKFAEELGFRMIEIYKDVESASLSEEHRHNFKRMMKDADKGKFDFILILDDSRFVRDVKDLLNYVDNLKEKNIYLKIRNFPLDIYTPDGRAFLTQSGMYSETERKKIIQRTRYGIKQKQKEQWVGNPPFGFDVDSEPKQNSKRGKNTYLVENEEEQDAIKIIIQYDNMNYALEDIAEILNSRGYLTKRNKIWNLYNLRNVMRTMKKDYSKYLKKDDK